MWKRGISEEGFERLAKKVAQENDNFSTLSMPDFCEKAVEIINNRTLEVEEGKATVEYPETDTGFISFTGKKQENLSRFEWRAHIQPQPSFVYVEFEWIVPDGRNFSEQQEAKYKPENLTPQRLADRFFEIYDPQPMESSILD